jgi:hypothetical protein
MRALERDAILGVARLLLNGLSILLDRDVPVASLRRALTATVERLRRSPRPARQHHERGDP